MSDTLITALIAPAILMILGGIGFGFKWAMSRADKSFDQKLAERNQEREEIRQDVTRLTQRVAQLDRTLKDVALLVAACDSPHCKVKAKVIQLLESDAAKFLDD